MDQKVSRIMVFKKKSQIVWSFSCAPLLSSPPPKNSVISRGRALFHQPELDFSLVSTASAWNSLFLLTFLSVSGYSPL